MAALPNRQIIIHAIGVMERSGIILVRGRF